MKKKLYISILGIIAIFALSFTYTFAANNISAVDGIRNVVGGAENVVEDAGRGIVDGVRNVTSGGENMMENAARDAQNGMQDAENRVTGAMTGDNYDATRTTRSAVNAGEGTFFGMNNTVWTWLIMAVVGIAIVALVWMYAKQNNNSYNE